jgi:hypothetical protein
LVVFNFSRTVAPDLDDEKRKKFLDPLYSLMEDLKDGLMFSGKYDGGPKLFDSPMVVVFANWEPDYTKWSADRYDVRKLD